VHCVVGGGFGWGGFGWGVRVMWCVVLCFWLFEFCFSFTRLLGCVVSVIGVQIRFVDVLVGAGVVLA